jgi:putative tryptophan/tyrosine transport system substrate-binding protein
MRRREFIAGLGTVAAWSARAQRASTPTIGFLSGLRETDYPAGTAAFHRGLGEQGYIDGQNVQIVFRWAELHYDRLPALALELVRRRVAVLFTGGGPASSLIAKSATAMIPIVFEHGGDPVELGSFQASTVRAEI